MNAGRENRLASQITKTPGSMMDYSEFQGPVQEWEDFMRANDFQNVPAKGVAAVQLRKGTNTARTLAARKIFANSREYSLKSMASRYGPLPVAWLTPLRSQEDLLEQVTWRDYAVLTRDFQHIIARVYRPAQTPSSLPLPVLLHFHGGGFLFGNVESEDVRCSRLIAGSSQPLIVVSINYRHTPEFQHPTQFNDAWDAFEWLSENIDELGGNAKQIIVEGISAGAGLAASIAMRSTETLEAHDQKSTRRGVPLRVRGQILAIPWLIQPARNHLYSREHSSFRQNQSSPILPMETLNLFATLLGDRAKSDPQSNVGLSEDSALACMPRTSVLVAGQDILRDEGLDFAERLRANGYVVTLMHSLILKQAIAPDQVSWWLA